MAIEQCSRQINKELFEKYRGRDSCFNKYTAIKILNMEENEDLIKVGTYNPEFNEILGIHISNLKIYRSKGLPTHMVKRKHFDCLRYIDYIPDIILKPDYIGINPNEQGKSIELIKRYDNNIMIGIKLDVDKGYLYVSTMHSIQESKISRRLHSGRLKEFTVDK